MKLLNLKCPNCSSHLQINADKDIAYCEYCGAKLLIDSETEKAELFNMKEAGYEFEKGRIQAQKAEKRKQALKPKLNIGGEKEQLVLIKTKRKRSGCFIIIIVLFILAVIFSQIVNSSNSGTDKTTVSSNSIFINIENSLRSQ